MKNYLIALCVFVGLSLSANAQISLQDSLPGKVGVYAVDSAGTELAAINVADHFPMLSVFKFPIALAVLTEIDKGNLQLLQQITITEQEMDPHTWSPLRNRYPHGCTLPISEILQYTISQSDNIGCDVLLELLGGPRNVEVFLKDRGFQDFAISVNEDEMHIRPKTMVRNWCTPKSMTELLKAYYYNRNNLLSEGSHTFLWQMMRETSTGPARL